MRHASKQRYWFGRFFGSGSAGQKRRTEHARQQESTIQALRDEIELLTRYSSDVVYRLRYSTMRYDYLSPSVERLLGYSPKELADMNLRDLILETRIVAEGFAPVRSYETLEAKRRRGEVTGWQADYRMKTKRGDEIWVMDMSYPWQDEKGAIIGSIGSLRDITDRVEAEQRQLNAQLNSGETEEKSPSDAENFWKAATQNQSAKAPETNAKANAQETAEGETSAALREPS